MVEDRIGAAEQEASSFWGWTHIFKAFQVALDPKKLVLAAAGIVATWLGWWLLSIIFFSARSEPQPAEFDAAAYRTKFNINDDEAKQRAELDYKAALDRYKLIYSLAGPANADAKEGWKQRGGLFRVAPWNEDRGPNPFKLVTDAAEREKTWEKGHFFDWLIKKQFPVLIEPLVKILQPVVLLLKPQAQGWNRIYLLCIALWTMAVWAFFGGAITRLAAVQLAGKDRPGIKETLRFVASRYLSYFSAPVIPILFVAALVLLSIVYGIIGHLAPVWGDIIDSVAWPFMMLLGFAQAILLLGLVGYPLMYSTISTEGSDTFDALSRSYNYVFQSPWNYIWYSLVAILYGAALVFFIGFLGSLVAYLTKWSVSQTPGTEYFTSRRVDNLFLYAPESFGWRDMLVDVPPLESAASEASRSEYLKNTFLFSNYLSAFMVSLWTTLLFLLVLGFGYSYFFSAFSMIYLLMRRKVDDTDLDEVYLEEDEESEPNLPPPATATPTAGGGLSLSVVEAPAGAAPAKPNSSEKPAGA